MLLMSDKNKHWSSQMPKMKGRIRKERSQTKIATSAYFGSILGPCGIYATHEMKLPVKTKTGVCAS
jgi:hypothetical protein